MKHFYLLVLLVGAATAASDTDGLISGALKFVKDCNDKSITLCIKVRRIDDFKLNFCDNLWAFLWAKWKISKKMWSTFELKK